MDESINTEGLNKPYPDGSFIKLTNIELHDYWEESLRRIFDLRKTFYQFLKTQLPEKFKGYYPGAANDPIPTDIFGKNIVYGSLPDVIDFFGQLKTGKPLRGDNYASYIEEKGPFKDLHAVYANVFNNPFPDNTFDLVIEHGLPPLTTRTDKRLPEEIYRILTVGGIFVLDDYVPIGTHPASSRAYRYTVNNFFDTGFKERRLNYPPGFTPSTYFYLDAPNDKQTSIVNNTRELMGKYGIAQFFRVFEK